MLRNRDYYKELQILLETETNISEYMKTNTDNSIL